MKRRRNGFSLMEILIALAIFVVVLGTAAQLFRTVFRSIADNRQLTTQDGQIDSAIVQLRGDAWSSSVISADTHSAVLSGQDGTKVTWAISDDGKVTRTDSLNHVRQWSGVGRSWTFSSDGPVLVVSDNDSQGPRAVRLVSQVLVSRRMQ